MTISDFDETTNQKTPMNFTMKPNHVIVAERIRSTEEHAMHIQINTDHNIEGHEKLTIYIEGVVERALSHISAHITRVEVHLSDQNGDKDGQDDKRCMMEARLEGRQPTAVTHHAASLNDAIHGAADKLKRSIESTLGRLKEVRRA